MNKLFLLAILSSFIFFSCAVLHDQNEKEKEWSNWPSHEKVD